MNRKLVIGISATVICIIVIAVAYFCFFREVKTEATLYISPTTVEGAVGQFVTINISISNVANLYGWQVKLEWNPQVLNISSVIEGTFLKNQSQTFFSYNFNETGSLILDCTLIGDVPGVNGSGTLATVKFIVKDEGTSELRLSETFLVDSAENLIPHTVKNGQFTT
ncbi:MAG: cohesin domain-containing protein [Candidatus Bathyarchaeia archaeon]